MRPAIGLVIIALLVAAAVFFADHPGRVAILWRGYEVETSIGVLAAAALLLAIGVALLLRLLRLVLGGPRRLSRWRRERRRRAGYRALSQGMVAVAAGEAQEAQRWARRADALLEDPPLTLLLSAQAAQLDGDESAATKFFTAMLQRPDTEFLGLRGLFNQAMRRRDRGAALQLAERARSLRPNAGWVSESLFELEIREGRWEAALKTLAQMAKRAMIPGDRSRHHRGVILHESSRALAASDRRQATRLAAQAQRATPDLAAPAIHYARLLLEGGRADAAAKAVEHAWQSAPHPELAQLYGEIHREAPPLARLKRFERLAAQNPEARETHLALAEAALAAQLWGEARRRLEQARNAPPATTTPRICLMMARLEEQERRDLAKVREWLDRAVAASPDPRHVCSHCDGESPEWRPLCPHCGSFDTLRWRVPAMSQAAAASPPALPLEAVVE